jgi:dTMP kinase
MTETGLFLTLEGIDGSGKSTQMRLLAEALRAEGRDVVTTCEPGGTPLGKLLRRVFLETEEKVEPTAELLLFAADRSQHVQHLILPALDQGKIVISDRYADSTVVYQGAGRGFPSDVIEKVIELATGGLKPDLTFFFDVPVENAARRTQSRVDKGRAHNRMDKEKARFYERARDGYLAIAEREPKRFRIIDANHSTDEVHLRTMKVLRDFLAERNK